MTLDCSRIAKEIAMVSGFFCWRKEADVALFLQVTRLSKISKIYKANLTSRLLPETGRSQSNKRWNMKQTKQIKIHQSQITKTRTFELVQVNMCFLWGPLRWLTEQKNPKFLWILQNAHCDTMNFAVKGIRVFIRHWRLENSPFTTQNSPTNVR